LQKHYGFRNLGVLQNTWLDWVARGSPSLGETPTVAAATNIAPTGNVVPTSAVASVAPTSKPAATISSGSAYQLAAATPVGAQSAEPWSGKKLPRPQPNLIHYDAERSIIAQPPTPGAPANVASSNVERPEPIGAGELVPINFDALPPAKDPFAAAPIAAPTSASRPQTPETPRQVILEWSKTADPPIDTPVATPFVPPMFDASTGTATMRR
jgi:hypothetical protein